MDPHEVNPQVLLLALAAIIAGAQRFGLPVKVGAKAPNAPIRVDVALDHVQGFVDL
jgi:hypothetical protein